MKNSEATFLLGNILGLSHNKLRNQVSRQLQDENMDWITFVKRGNRYLILPAVYYELDNAGLLHLLPTDLKDHLHQIFTLAQKRNHAILSQLKKVSMLLNAHGIIPTVLKGGGNLAEGLYPDYGVRIMTDLDLLVPDEHFLKSAELLMKDGYHAQYHFNDLYTSIEQAKDYPRLYRKSAVVDIEIHRLPVATEFVKHFDYKIATQGQRLIENEGYKIHVLSVENNMLLNFIHSQLTDKAALYKKVNLKNMYDLWLLSQKTNPSKVFTKFSHYKKQANAYDGAVQQMFGGSQAKSWRTQKEGAIYLDKALYNVDHSKQFYRKKRIKYALWRIKYSYIKFPLSVLSSKDNFKLLIKKLSNPKWYKKHVGSLKS